MNASRDIQCRLALAAAVLCIALPPASAQLDRSKHPVDPPAAPFVFPKVETRTLSNGLQVSVVENHELPVVAVRVVIEGGPILDPVGKEGMYQLMGSMLAEGTATLTSNQLAEAFSDQGNSVSPNGFTTISRNVDRSMALLADMIMHPAFPQDALDRQKANLTTNLQRVKDQPGYAAQRIFDANVYGAGHLYERTPTPQSVASITREDLVKFHADYAHPQNVHFVVVGDVTPASIVPRMERAFGAWAKGGTTVAYQVPAPKAPDKTTIYLYDRPNSPQSVVTIGQLGPSRSVDDFYALELMNTVLGQLSGSRLNQNLREKHAYTYGINSIWQWRRAPEVATFLGSSNITASKTDSGVVEWMRELRGIRGERPVTDAELSFARTNRIAGLPASLESNDQVANGVATLIRNNLPLDYYQRYVNRIAGLSGTDIATVATKYLDPDHMAIVIVGDRKAIEPGLIAANIAPIVIVDENGKVVP